MNDMIVVLIDQNKRFINQNDVFFARYARNFRFFNDNNNRNNEKNNEKNNENKKKMKIMITKIKMKSQTIIKTKKKNFSIYVKQKKKLTRKIANTNTSNFVFQIDYLLKQKSISSLIEIVLMFFCLFFHESIKINLMKLKINQNVLFRDHRFRFSNFSSIFQSNHEY